MRNKTRLPQFQANLMYIKENDEYKLVESPFYDLYEHCNYFGHESKGFSWRVTSLEIYKFIQPKLKEINNHPHAGHRVMKYMSLRATVKKLQKVGFFPTLELIPKNKKVKTK